MASLVVAIIGFLFLAGGSLIFWVLVSCKTCTEALAGLFMVAMLAVAAVAAGIMAIAIGVPVRRTPGQTKRATTLATFGIVLGSVTVVTVVVSVLVVIFLFARALSRA